MIDEFPTTHLGPLHGLALDAADPFTHSHPPTNTDHPIPHDPTQIEPLPQLRDSSYFQALHGQELPINPAATGAEVPVPDSGFMSLTSSSTSPQNTLAPRVWEVPRTCALEDLVLYYVNS